MSETAELDGYRQPAALIFRVEPLRVQTWSTALTEEEQGRLLSFLRGQPDVFEWCKTGFTLARRTTPASGGRA